VDFRGDGGYVIVPPSIIIAPGHGGVGYRLIQSQPGAVPVDGGRLEAAVDPGRAERRSLAKRVGLRRSTVNADRLVGWVSSLQMGERNQGLFWAACRLAESGQAIDDTLGLLTSAAERAGLVEREIRTTVVSAYRHVHPTVSGSAVVTASVPSREPVVEAMVL
jgi:hypothetical protein